VERDFGEGKRRRERAIFDILQDAAEVERLFPIIKQQPDY
jgi:hypothetical protein